MKRQNTLEHMALGRETFNDLVKKIDEIALIIDLVVERLQKLKKQIKEVKK